MQIVWGAAAITIVGCSGAPERHPDATSGAPDARVIDPQIDASLFVDDDHDGLDDQRELELAAAYEPFVSLDPADACPLDGFVVRVRPHPADPTKILIVYDQLFLHDCGLNGHVGDDEVFGVTIDPSRPAPDGILAIKAASHQGTVCERDSECSTCGASDSRTACDTAMIGGATWPVVFAAKDKHGHYATQASCGSFTCLDSCTLAITPHRPPIVNAGEPDAPLVHDLTDGGFITAANGWTEPALMHFDPWDPAKDFGGAGNIAGDLQDSAFTAAPCP